MKLLLDTHILLWSLKDDRRIPPSTRRLITNPHNEILVSAASFWEAGLKRSLGKLEIELSKLEEILIATGFKMIDVTPRHAVIACELPLHHRDPFDRMLVAQAITETARLLTSDETLRTYGSAVMVV